MKLSSQGERPTAAAAPAIAGKGVQGGVLPGRRRFRPAVAEGSREAVFLERRRRWARAVRDWLADGRPDSLVLEPGPAWPS